MTDELPLLVGESNPYGADPYYALYPAPDGCAGHRLCCKVLGMRRAVYMRVFDRVNLCDGPWRIKEARAKADTLRGRQLILLGSKVCSAFGIDFTPFAIVAGLGVVLPHPSGLCRLWSKPGAIEKARNCVFTFIPELALIVAEDARPKTIGYGHNDEVD